MLEKVKIDLNRSTNVDSILYLWITLPTIFIKKNMKKTNL
jgi:hypothetical protein